MGEGVLVVAYDDAWPAIFAEVGARLRRELGEAALRIDHIGSTAVVGLDAKPVVDVQVSVGSLEPLDAFRLPIERAGFVYRPDNPELTKRYFRERPGERRTHIHVRRAGSFSEQFALLFRDFLRSHPDHAQKYADLKHQLAKEFSAPDQRSDYVAQRRPSSGTPSTSPTTGHSRLAGNPHRPTAECLGGSDWVSCGVGEGVEGAEGGAEGDDGAGEHADGGKGEGGADADGGG
jgi:GrpB-like predicted nucleotidyltransferase (UPF0157 family)